MKITLCDIQKPLIQAWENIFKNIPEVKIFCGDIFSCGNHEALISPANSFAYMDGGIDWIYTKRFGWQLQEKLQTRIKSRPMGELLVGEALVVPTGDPDYPNLISAPTMRVPTDVSKTVNAYLAFKTALIIAKQYNFKTLLCPGLGTSAGKMSGEVCAAQMYQAYIDVFEGIKFPRTLVEAGRKHLSLGGATWYV